MSFEENINSKNNELNSEIDNHKQQISNNFFKVEKINIINDNFSENDPTQFITETTPLFTYFSYPYQGLDFGFYAKE